MKLFKRKTADAAESSFSARWNEKAIRQQHRIADYLNEKTKCLSGKAQLLLLLLFCVGFGAYCLYLICTAIN